MAAAIQKSLGGCFLLSGLSGPAVVGLGDGKDGFSHSLLGGFIDQ